MGQDFQFAELITTLATGLTVVNVYSTASVSSPPSFTGLSFRSQRRFGHRTITSSARLYMTMVIPYVAATVLVQEIGTEEVTPIFIAAVASISGRFNKGRHTFIEWIFKILRTFTCMIVLALFMLFQGLSGEIYRGPVSQNILKRVFDLRMFPQHVLLSMILSFRWFILLFLGFLTVPEKEKKLNVLLAVLKITLVWILITGTGSWKSESAYVAFDLVIVQRTPLRDTVFALYSILIALDAAECVTTTIVAERRIREEDEMEGMRDEEMCGSVCTDEEDPEPSSSEMVGSFQPLTALNRRRSNMSTLLNWEDFSEEALRSIKHYVQISLARLRRPPSDSGLEDSGDDRGSVPVPISINNVQEPPALHHTVIDMDGAEKRIPEAERMEDEQPDAINVEQQTQISTSTPAVVVLGEEESSSSDGPNHPT